MFFKCRKAIAVALLALPYVSAAHATIIINCKDPVLAVVLDVAVDEAVTMAQGMFLFRIKKASLTV